MMKETEAIIHMDLDFLPLKTNANIVEGNALQMDWKSIVPKSELNYIMGNPPFVGGMMMSQFQKSELEKVFEDLSIKNVGELDYVSAWYKKAFDLVKGTNIRVAFVSTNSICQGQQAFSLWKPLFERGLTIIFAYKTFIWDSEANDRANVHCVIVGFFVNNNRVDKITKKLYDNNVRYVDNINAYLTEGPSIFISSRKDPICNVPKMRFGSMPRDGGNFILNDEERNLILEKEPFISKYIRPYIGAYEFINKKSRWCLWLVNAKPEDIRNSKFIKDRIEKVKEFRLKSKAAATRKFAETPMIFCQIAQPNSNYIAVPKTSSERRRYVPMGFLTKNIIASDLLFMIPGATLYHFGILTSNVHMAWMRTVAGRLKSDYRYSKDIVYNNFPWPNPTEEQKKAIEITAQAILDARALYPESSLADLYDETTMPIELRRAHRANDKAVMQAYGFWGKLNSETEAVAELMKMYQQLTNN